MERHSQSLNLDLVANGSDRHMAGVGTEHLVSTDDGVAADGFDSSQQQFSHQYERLHKEVIMNWTQQNFEMHYDLLKRPVWRGIILALYVSVIIIGIIGNGIVVYIVARNKSMQNITNILIANLALSDIGLCVFSLPIQLHYQMTDTWIFGDCMCRVIFAAFAVPMYVSTLTILLIAFDRYWLIVFPLRERMSTRLTFISIVVSVLVSMLLAIPVMMYSVLHQVEEPDIGLYRTYCLEVWPSETARIVYTLLTFIFQFCLPLAITALLYYRIYCRLQHRPTQRIAHHERKQKTNKILVAIVTLFVVCWLPWNLFSLLTEIDSEIVKGPHYKFVDLLLKVFSMGSACINPFLYCWLNDNFRKELDNMAIKLHIIRDPSQHRHKPTPTYRVTAPEDNGLTATDQVCGTTTLGDRFSTAVTMERTAVSYYPDNEDVANGYANVPQLYPVKKRPLDHL